MIAADERFTDVTSLSLFHFECSTGEERERNLILQTFSPFRKILNWIEPTIFLYKCQPMENMTECGFVHLFRDHTHTRYEIMSNFDVKRSQVVHLF